MLPRWATAFLLGFAWCFAGAPATAQETADDAAAREYFERGEAAFADANYENALLYFRHAYRMSGRPELQYNIGMTAARLQRDEEALEAFERYLEEGDPPAREFEVRERIAALKQEMAERQATARALAEATGRYEPVSYTVDERTRRRPTSAIVGSSLLIAVGAAGLAAMSVALVRDGSCEQRQDDQCVVERSTSTAAWIYGGVGAAALAGGLTWLVVSGHKNKKRETTVVRISPTGVLVRGHF